MAGDTSVTPVTVDERPVGHVFGFGSKFFFVLDDRRDRKARGPYHDEATALTAAEHQVRCMAIAERWELMLDT
jgi:hypothetical protein